MAEQILANDYKGAVPPAIMEWLRWRDETPQMYTCLADMPAKLAEQFEYLCRTLGRQKSTLIDDMHQAGIEAEKAKMRALMQF